MSYYSNYPVDRSVMTVETGAPCYDLGTGQSHERLIQSAGGEIGYDGFRDPRPDHDGPIYADRVFINERTNEIQGINFVGKDNKFCCSYMGQSYSDIKDSNKLDMENKLTQTENKTQEFNRNIQNGIKR